MLPGQQILVVEFIWLILYKWWQMSNFCDRCSAICFIFLFAAVLHYKVHIFYFKMVFKGNNLVVTFFFLFFSHWNFTPRAANSFFRRLSWHQVSPVLFLICSPFLQSNLALDCTPASAQTCSFVDCGRLFISPDNCLCCEDLSWPAISFLSLFSCLVLSLFDEAEAFSDAFLGLVIFFRMSGWPPVLQSTVTLSDERFSWRLTKCVLSFCSASFRGASCGCCRHSLMLTS